MMIRDKIQSPQERTAREDRGKGPFITSKKMKEKNPNLRQLPERRRERGKQRAEEELLPKKDSFLASTGRGGGGGTNTSY